MECGKKVTFGSEKDAEFYIHKLGKSSVRDTVPTRAYKCNKCGGYHLTSKPNWNDKLSKLEEEVTHLKSRNAFLERENDLLKKGSMEKVMNINEQLQNSVNKSKAKIKALEKDKDDLMKTLIRIQNESKK